MARKPTDKSHQFAVSDEAAAYIADALTQLALQFEAKHFAQIRRYYQSIAPERDDDASQPDLFGEHPRGAQTVARECSAKSSAANPPPITAQPPR